MKKFKTFKLSLIGYVKAQTIGEAVNSFKPSENVSLLMEMLDSESDVKVQVIDELENNKYEFRVTLTLAVEAKNERLAVLTARDMLRLPISVSIVSKSGGIYETGSTEQLHQSIN